MHDSRHSIQLIVLGVSLWLAMSVKNTGGSPKHIHASSDFSPPKIFGKSNLLVEKRYARAVSSLRPVGTTWAFSKAAFFAQAFWRWPIRRPNPRHPSSSRGHRCFAGSPTLASSNRLGSVSRSGEADEFAYVFGKPGRNLVLLSAPTRERALAAIATEVRG
jgi:hypothetical protein